MMNNRFTSTADQQFGDTIIDVSQTERRLIRVTTKTYDSTGTYIFIKLFKKASDDEFHTDQRVTLTLSEFQALINNSENINMGPNPVKDGKVGTFKRPQKNGSGS